MSMLCRAMQRESSIAVTGLCHSVQGTARMLARWLKTPMDRIRYLCAGINHMAWFLEFKKDGKNAYPLLQKAIQKPEIYRTELVRNEMFRHLGYYVTESSGHNSEYNAWFRKRPDLLKKYCSPHKYSEWNPGEHAAILRDYLRQGKEWRKWIRSWFKHPLKMERGHEYAAPIMNAWMGGEPYAFNGNVPNMGLVPNLPHRACVEVPVFAAQGRLNSVYVGALPPQCALLTNLSSNIEEVAVEAALTGDPEMVYCAVAHDPLTSAILSLAEIRKMVREMLQKNRGHLPQFKSIAI
jgi:alpha-galactosidase